MDTGGQAWQGTRTRGGYQGQEGTEASCLGWQGQEAHDKGKRGRGLVPRLTRARGNLSQTRKIRRKALYYCMMQWKKFKMDFCVFFKKEQKPVFFKKTKTGGLFFSKKNGSFSTLNDFQSFFWFSLDRTIWNKSHHYQLDWVCAAHLEL